MIIIALICFWETRPYLLQTPKLVKWSAIRFCLSCALSLAPFITSGGFLELEEWPPCAEARSRLVRHAKCQASWGVDARVTEVKACAAAAAATKTCTQTASCGLTRGGEGKRRPPSPHPTKSWPTTKTWSWLLLLGQRGCHGNRCSIGYTGEWGRPSRDSRRTLPLPVRCPFGLKDVCGVFQEGPAVG